MSKERNQSLPCDMDDCKKSTDCSLRKYINYQNQLDNKYDPLLVPSLPKRTTESSITFTDTCTHVGIHARIHMHTRPGRRTGKLHQAVKRRFFCF